MVFAVIPMNGRGTRFAEIGYKPLVLVDGRPMIQHVLELFPSDVPVLCLYDPEHPEVLPYLPQAVPVPYTGKGPVATVLDAADSIPDDEEILISYCDYGMEWDPEAFLQEMREANAEGGLVCYTGFHPHHLGADCYAYARTNEAGDVVEVREKTPFTEDKLSEYASSGMYYFRTGRAMKAAFRALLEHPEEHIRGEAYVSLAYNHLPGRIRVGLIPTMLQWGTPTDLADYQGWSDAFRYPQGRRITAPGITILPMAGRGSRFSMVGYTTPKPFLPIGEDPMVVAALRCLPLTPDLRIVTLREHPDIQPYVPEAKVYRIDDVTDGQATTCMHAMEDIPDDLPVTITACDNGALYSTDALQRLLDDTTIDCIVWAFKQTATSRLYPHMYAWLDVDESMQLRDVSVKKPFADRPNEYAIIGTMFFRRAGDFHWGYNFIRTHDLRTNGELYVDNLLKPLVDAGKRIVVFPVDHYICWGTPNDYKTFRYWETYFSHADRTPSEHSGGSCAGTVPSRD